MVTTLFARPSLNVIAPKEGEVEVYADAYKDKDGKVVIVQR